MSEESQRQVDNNETPNPMKSVLDELAKLRKENERLNGRLDELVQSVQQPSARKSLFSKKRMQPTVDPSCSDAVRKTYKELKKQKKDFNGFKTDVRYDDEENKKIEDILVK
ncbi:uncharacterized protein [Montipora capricornis]|uniref:uncharacterized protein n=1 Tax=Montipora capricornis TaxID=246305 RepID=UPI0035F12EBC